MYNNYVLNYVQYICGTWAKEWVILDLNYIIELHRITDSQMREGF